MSATKDVINAVQARCAAVSGIVSAPALTLYPASLNSAQLPLAMTWPGAGAWSWHALNGLTRRTQEFVVSIFIEPVGQNILGPAAVKGVDLMDAIDDAFGAALAQDLDDTVEQIETIRCSALIELTYGEQVYRGFQIFIPTIRKRDLP